MLVTAVKATGRPAGCLARIPELLSIGHPSTVLEYLVVPYANTALSCRKQ